MGEEERTYMVLGEDENGDYHLFATNSRDRAATAYADRQSWLRNVRANEGLTDAMEGRDEGVPDHPA